MADHRVTPIDAETVRVTLSIRQSGPLAPIIGHLYAGLTRRYLNMEAQGVKQRCEGLSETQQDDGILRLMRAV